MKIPRRKKSRYLTCNHFVLQETSESKAISTEETLKGAERERVSPSPALSVSALMP
jgi:hypothetical protein